MNDLKKQIKISQILEDLENGVTRAEMVTKYGITPREVKVLFEHPKLKGKKARKVFKPSFDIVDDLEPDAEQAVTEETSTQQDNEQVGYFE
jgi:hypothetical protein